MRSEMRCALIGERLGHSYSKLIHEKLGKYAYDLIETDAGGLEDVLGDTRYAGFNVTIPYKREVMRFCGSLSPVAESVGSVNTILRLPDGALRGHNTDFEGFREMARRAGIDFAGKKVLILGSGGTSATARAVVTAQGAAEIVTVSRTGKVGYGDLRLHRDAQVIINTTPVGMYPAGGERPVDLGAFPSLTGVADVIYNPLRTRLVQQAQELNIPCCGGLYMLVGQAAAACEIFTGQPLDGARRRIYEDFRAQAENIVITGMPGSGKTSVAAIIAEKTGRRHIDTDELAVKTAARSIPEIFRDEGEERFRQYERDAVAQCSQMTGVVISTGGGAVLYEENRLNLRQNGRVYLLLRDVENLETRGRPLSSGLDALRRMEAERMPAYRQSAHVQIENNGKPERTAECILEEFYEGTSN